MEAQEKLPLNLLVRIGKEGRQLPVLYRGRTFHRNMLFGNDPEELVHIDIAPTVYKPEPWPGELGVPYFFPHERYAVRFS